MSSDKCPEAISIYVNGQLRLLYEKAKIKTSENADVTCLAAFDSAKFYEHSHTDHTFSAKFGCPHVKIVCNHEVVLFLHLLEGRLNYKLAAHSRELPEMIEGCQLAFRIPLIHTLQDSRASDVDSAGYNKTVLVLNMSSAVFLPEHSKFSESTSNFHKSDFDTKERKVADLTRCLKDSYFSTLKRAFEHKLFWLPDSENVRKQFNDSFIHPFTLATDTLFGMRVKDINDYLHRGLKLQTVVSVSTRGVQNGTVTQSFEPSSEGDDNGMRMSLSFGSLHIQRLCECEVVLYFDIQGIDVDFGVSSDKPQQRWKKWKIAFIASALSEEVNEHSPKGIKIDPNGPTARFCEHLSVFGEHHDVRLLERIKKAVVIQIETKYHSILEGTTIIYSSAHGGGADNAESPDLHVDDDVHMRDCMCTDEESCGHTGGIRWGVIQRRILTETYAGKFDLITALTQRSINANFEARWKSAYQITSMSGANAEEARKIGESELNACLAYFSVVHPEKGGEIAFTATFNAPSVQLVSKEGTQSVILYLYISESSLKTLSSERSVQRGTDTREFSGCLAYKVKLEPIDFKEGHKQLVLSLASATLDWDQSSVTDMFRGPDDSRYHGVLADFIEKSYFPVFMRANHHVLYTMSQSISGDPDRRHAFTSLPFKIIPFNYETGAQRLELSIECRRAISERDAIVIMGVTSDRPLPRHSFPAGRNWIFSFGKEIPLGMVYLSRKFFLDDVLRKLERINRATTIVPIISGNGKNQRDFELAPWNVLEVKDAYCNWREVAKKDNIDSLEFEWKRYKQLRCLEGDDLYNNDSRTVGCATHNIFSVPTSRDGKSVIHLQGKVDMRLKHEVKGKCWSFESTATWSANINFVSTTSGLRVQLHPERIEPKFSPANVSAVAPEFERQMQAQALDEFKAKFPDFVDFSAVVGELKEMLEGTWTGVQVQAHEYCVAQPMFNAHGDLLLELAVRDKHVAGASSISTSYSALVRNGKAK